MTREEEECEKARAKYIIEVDRQRQLAMDKKMDSLIRNKSTLDPNERFLLRIIAGYLLKVEDLINTKALELCSWLLGRETIPLPEKFSDCLRKIKFGEWAGKTRKNTPQEIEPDDLSRVISRSREITAKDIAILSSHLRQLLEECAQSLKSHTKSDLEKNLDQFGRLLNMADHEKRLLLFCYIINTIKQADSYFNDHLDLLRVTRRNLLAHIIGVKTSEVGEFFQGRFKRMGIFQSHRYRGQMLSDDYLQLLENPNNENMSDTLFKKFKGPALPMNEHLVDQKAVSFMLELLKNPGDHPVQILLYGPPGTGKTSLAYSLLMEAGLPAYSITQDVANQNSSRRVAIEACLNLIGDHGKGVILVDEADHLLNPGFIANDKNDKAWLNMLLEKPRARMIWIVNHWHHIETSTLRRFTYSLHFHDQNLPQRVKLWERLLVKNQVQNLLTGEEIKNLAEQYEINVAGISDIIGSASRNAANDKPKFISLLTNSMDAYVEVLNGGEKPKRGFQFEEKYSLSGINTDMAPDQLVSELTVAEMLRGSGERRTSTLLLYGPPGAGKSEFAKYLSKELTKRLLVKRASDLLSPWVGMNERNIAHAFEQAERDNALLLIDEADTFIFPRSMAQRSWETSMTNEFLTQIENFQGILLCTTNRYQGLDIASIRRFTYKIKFDYLKNAQKKELYSALLEPIAKAPLDPESEQELFSIPKLVPGDFRVVRDQAILRRDDFRDHRLMISALRQEVEHKCNNLEMKQIGF